jgi:large subunit ribosomal protein L43
MSGGFSYFLRTGFVNAPLSNGIGRFVQQCNRMTIKFCKSGGGSGGVREFIQNDLVDFARQNPGTVLYLKPRRHRSPVVVAEYCEYSL